MNPPSVSMHNKLCLITGATQGIGKETALALAQMGARLVLVARNSARGETTVTELKKQTDNPDISLLLADLSSQTAIRQLAENFLRQHDRLDVLINNAGAIFTKKQMTVDGLEMTFAMNHLGYFLLTNLLLPVLKKSAPSRIVNVASRAHVGMKLNFGDLQGEQKYSGWRSYGQSKLANIMFTYELARRLQGTNVTVNCLHPGVIASGFGQNTPGIFQSLVKIAAPFMLTPQKGARTTIYLASSPEVEGVTGKYFANCKEQRSSAVSYDEEAARKLWEVSAQLTGISSE